MRRDQQTEQTEFSLKSTRQCVLNLGTLAQSTTQQLFCKSPKSRKQLWRLQACQHIKGLLQANKSNAIEIDRVTVGGGGKSRQQIGQSTLAPQRWGQRQTTGKTNWHMMLRKARTKRLLVAPTSKNLEND